MIQKLIYYIRSLLPTFERNRLEKELDAAVNELSEYTIPMYDRTSEIMQGRDFNTDEVKEFERRFQKAIQTKYRGNFIEVTHAILQDTEQTAVKLQKMVRDNFSNDVNPSALTYGQAQLLKVAEALDFVARYSRMILMFTLMRETAYFRSNAMKRYELAPAQIRWIQDNQMKYLVALRVFTKKPKEIERTIDEIPDVQIDENNVESLVSQTGFKRIDPFQLQGLTTMNPIYHIRAPYEEWRVARYESAKEERRMLEYQIRDLQAALEERDDPKLEQALEYQMDRVKRLDHKIKQFEEKVHGDD